MLSRMPSVLRGIVINTRNLRRFPCFCALCRVICDLSEEIGHRAPLRCLAMDDLASVAARLLLCYGRQIRAILCAIALSFRVAWSSPPSINRRICVPDHRFVESHTCVPDHRFVELYTCVPDHRFVESYTCVPDHRFVESYTCVGQSAGRDTT